MNSVNIRRMTIDSMLSAMVAVLAYVSVYAGGVKVTFEGVPVLVGAMLLGPLDGFMIGLVGTGIYQLSRYGVTATTLLWMLPYMFSGLFMGYFMKKGNFKMHNRQTLVLILINEILISIMNTCSLYIDSHIYGYYTFAIVFGVFFVRIIIAIVKSIAYSYILPVAVKAGRKVVSIESLLRGEV